MSKLGRRGPSPGWGSPAGPGRWVVVGEGKQGRAPDAGAVAKRCTSSALLGPPLPPRARRTPTPALAPEPCSDRQPGSQSRGRGPLAPGECVCGVTRTPLPAAEKLLRWAGAKEAVGDSAPWGGRRGWHRRPRLPGSPRPPLQLLQKWAPQLSPSRSTCPPGARTPPPRPTHPQLRQHHPSPTTCTCPPHHALPQGHPFQHSFLAESSMDTGAGSLFAAGPSWAPYSVEQHTWSPPTRCQWRPPQLPPDAANCPLGDGHSGRH